MVRDEWGNLRRFAEDWEASRSRRKQAIERSEKPTFRCAAQAGLTFAQVADAYIAAHEPSWRNAKHRQQWRNTLRHLCRPDPRQAAGGDRWTLAR